MKRFSETLLVVGALLIGAVADAGVYRWVDENGRVHFGDRPPTDGGEQVRITPAAPSPQAPKPASVPDRQRMLDMYESERQAKRAAKAEQAKRRAEQARACKENEAVLRYYLSGGPLYEDRPTGRYYLTAAEKDQELDQLRSDLARHCGGLPADLRPKDGR